jgi:hypothetical protein
VSGTVITKTVKQRVVEVSRRLTQGNAFAARALRARSRGGMQWKTACIERVHATFCHSSLMSKDVTTRLFEIVLSPWKIRNVRTEKEMGSRSLCDVQKMRESILLLWTYVFGLFLKKPHYEEKAEVPFFHAPWLLLVKDLCHMMNPSRDLAKGLPIRLPRLHTLLQNALEAFERL